MELSAYKKTIIEAIKCQRRFFAEGKTRPLSHRIDQLRRLQQAIEKNEQAILTALKEDLGKSEEEGYLTEVSIVLGEIRTHIRHLRKWAKPRRVTTPLQLLPARSYTQFEPYGTVLILSPWNYPFQLLINPLVAALSAGNTALLKPSPLSRATNRVVSTIIKECFPIEEVALFEGDREQTLTILEEKFDLIFFTGSPGFGQEVMRKASAHLTPVVLELGGKSPCIVDSTANIERTAQRIVWGKLLNAGQTCVAPDYLLVHHSIEKRLIEAIKRSIIRFYGNDAAQSPFYPRIITTQALERLQNYLSDGEIVFGGEIDSSQRYLSPTILRNPSWESPVMTHEIFGPIFPILTYQTTEEVIERISSRPKPLALYYFGESNEANRVIAATSSGGACINDVIIHLANHHLPFGGVGNSGMGRYHGYYGFMSFSHERAIIRSTLRFELPFRYIPYKFFSLIKRIL